MDSKSLLSFMLDVLGKPENIDLSDCFHEEFEENMWLLEHTAEEERKRFIEYLSKYNPDDCELITLNPIPNLTRYWLYPNTNNNDFVVERENGKKKSLIRWNVVIGEDRISISNVLDHQKPIVTALAFKK